MAALAVSCGDSGDDPTPDSKPLPMDVLVTSEGYVASGAAGSDKNYPVELAEGTAVGLYVVHGDGRSEGPVKLTLGPDEAWTAESGVSLGYVEGDKFFAFCPYDEQLAGKVDASATTDEAFFAELIAGWTPRTDQSADFAASALLTGTGVVTKVGPVASLDLQMKPRTALAVLTFPATKYVFDNQPAIPEYRVAASGITFDNGVKAHVAADGSYLYQVNPAQSTTPPLSGKYGDDKPWKQEVADLKSGCYTLCPIGGGEVEKHHTLQVGDFFLSDGNLLAKDADAATVGAARVVGVVFQIDPSRIPESDKKALGGIVHAQVLSTGGIFRKFDQSANNAKWCVWGGSGERDESELIPYVDPEGDVKTVAKRCDECLDGYAYTQAILKNRKKDVEAYRYPVFKDMLDFAAGKGALAGGVRSTGWYLPAVGQWFDIIRNLGGYALDVNGADLGNNEGYYFFAWNNPKKIDVVGNLNKAMQSVKAECKAEYPAGTSFLWCSSVLSDKEAHLLSIASPISGVSDNMDVVVWTGEKKDPRGARLILTF